MKSPLEEKLGRDPRKTFF